MCRILSYHLLLNKQFALCVQNSDLTQLASEARAMKDELDILRHVSDQVVSSHSSSPNLSRHVFICLCPQPGCVDLSF